MKDMEQIEAKVWKFIAECTTKAGNTVSVIYYRAFDSEFSRREVADIMYTVIENDNKEAGRSLVRLTTSLAEKESMPLLSSKNNLNELTPENMEQFFNAISEDEFNKEPKPAEIKYPYYWRIYTHYYRIEQQKTTCLFAKTVRRWMKFKPTQYEVVGTCQDKNLIYLQLNDRSSLPKQAVINKETLTDKQGVQFYTTDMVIDVCNQLNNVLLRAEWKRDGE